MVKLGALCFGGPGSVPRRRPAPVIGGHAVAVTHRQNRGRLAQKLAQGESSSAKKKKKRKYKHSLLKGGMNLNLNNLPKLLAHQFYYIIDESWI